MKIKYLLIILFIIPFITGCTFKSVNPSNDGGIFSSTDFGQNWNHTISLVQDNTIIGSIGNIDTSYMTFDPQDKNKIYLTTLNQGIYLSLDRGQHWSATTLASGNYLNLSIDHLNTDVLYTTDGASIIKTVDGMKTWHQIYFENRPNQKIVSVLADPFKSSIVYAATTTGIIKSLDYGNTWKLLNWSGPPIRFLGISEINSNTLFTLTTTGVYKTTDGAVIWEDVSNELVDFGIASRINNILFDPKTEYIHIGTATGIFRSLDSGQSWKTIPTLFDFNKISIGAVTYNPSNLNVIIFSFSNILHKTDDGGKTWRTLKTVPTTRIINYLVADPYHDDVVFLGTFRPAS